MHSITFIHRQIIVRPRLGRLHIKQETKAPKVPIIRADFKITFTLSQTNDTLAFGLSFLYFLHRPLTMS